MVPLDEPQVPRNGMKELPRLRGAYCLESVSVLDRSPTYGYEILAR